MARERRFPCAMHMLMRHAQSHAHAHAHAHRAPPRLPRGPLEPGNTTRDLVIVGADAHALDRLAGGGAALCVLAVGRVDRGRALEDAVLLPARVVKGLRARVAIQREGFRNLWEISQVGMRARGSLDRDGRTHAERRGRHGRRQVGRARGARARRRTDVAADAGDLDRDLVRRLRARGETGSRFSDREERPRVARVRAQVHTRTQVPGSRTAHARSRSLGRRSGRWRRDPPCICGCGRRRTTRVPSRSSAPGEAPRMSISPHLG